MSSDDRCPECGGYRGLPRILHDQDTPRECSHEFHKQADVVEFRVPNSDPPKPAGDPGAQQASEAQAASDQVSVPMPKCPHCDAEDGMFFAKQAHLAHGKIALAVICCRHCNKPWGVTQILELQMVPMPGPGLPGLPGRPM